MMKLVLSRLWLEIRRNLPWFFIYLFLGLILMAFVGGFMVIQLIFNFYSIYGAVPEEANQAQVLELIMPLLEQGLTPYACIFSAILLFLIILISSRLPLRIPRALYVCAAGEKEKLRFLKLYLAAKLVFCLLLYTLSAIYMFGFVVSYDITAIFLQVTLMLFLLFAVNLNTDPGNLKEARKQVPDLITERSSATLVSVYWTALLILENTLFYSLTFAGTKWTLPLTAAWIPMFLVNLYIGRRHTVPVLRHMLNYEQLYYPLPDKQTNDHKEG